MKEKLLITSLCFTLVGGGYVFANEGHEHGDKKDSSTTKHEEVTQQEGENDGAAAVEVGNKICPVSGEKVGEMGEIIKYEYNGKIYNLCCSMCAKDFKKDPEKYSKIAEDEVKKNEEIQADQTEGSGDHEAHEGH